jgi:hypothetical protein
MPSSNAYWKTVPRGSLLLFLLGVSCIFSTVGFASDILEMGRQPMPRYVMSVMLSGIFPALYALSGFILRKRFWKAFLPLFAVHFVLMNVLAQSFPDVARPLQMDAAEIARLHSRLNIDALATILAVGIGYTCFAYGSVSEARRYFRVHMQMELAREIHGVIVPPIDVKMGSSSLGGRCRAGKWAAT